LKLSANDLQVIKWYLNTFFTVHADFISHTGAIKSYGNGATMTMSRKQKLITCSCTEAKLVGVNYTVNMIAWPKLFLGAQDYHVNNIQYTSITRAPSYWKGTAKNALARGQAQQTLGISSFKLPTN
jgi:hypothetical protein